MSNVRRQSTLNAPVFTAGIELHGGEHTRIVLRPAPMGTGIIFVRTDITDRDNQIIVTPDACLLYTSPSPRDATLSRMPSSA